MTKSQSGERVGAKDVSAVVGLSLLGVGIPLWLAAAAGAIGIPSNDDWVYMRAASSLFRTGSIDMVAHTTAFIGQLALVQPFLWLSGGSPWAFTAFGLVLAAVGIVATYLLARRFVGVGSAVLVVLLVEAFPGFARQSASFMTDGPTYSFIALSLLLGVRWLQGDGGRATLLASIAVGLLAVSIREFAIAAPVAILIVAWVRSRASQRLWLAVLSGSLAGGVLCLKVIGTALPGNAQEVSANVHWISILGPAFITLAAVLLPAAALAMGGRIAGFDAKHLIVGAGLVCLMVAVAPNGPIVGNLWTATGLGGGYHGPGGYYGVYGGDFFLTGSRDFVFGATEWALSEQLATFSAIVLAALGFRWGLRHLASVDSIPTGKAAAIRIMSSRDAPLLVFLLLYGAELAAYAWIGAVYDRYLYPLVPVAAVLLLRGPARPFTLRRSHAFAHGAFAWLAVSAFIIAANSFAYDSARHREGEVAVSMGYDPGTVDAGYEWVGFYGVGPEMPYSNPRSLNWWEDNWPLFRPCAVLSNSPLDIDGYRLVRMNESAYQRFLFFGPDEPLYLYGAAMDGCPQPTAAFAPSAIVTRPLRRR